MRLEDLAQRITNLENDMMLVKDGSLVEHISEAIHWKDTTKTLTGGTDYTADGDWTDLDLNLWTSDKAKYAILLLYHTTSATAADTLGIRKNGTTPTKTPNIYCQVTGVANRGFIITAMDSGQVVEYYATDASDTEIIVLGWIE